jgi:hypothetical protein
MNRIMLALVATTFVASVTSAYAVENSEVSATPDTAPMAAPDAIAVDSAAPFQAEPASQVNTTDPAESK